MAICVGCGLEVDNNNVLKVHLASASGILCSDTDGLSVNTGCGLQITAANEVAIRGATDSTVAYANNDSNGTTDADFAPVIGVGAGTCAGNNRNGLVCDPTVGLWSPGKLGHALSAQETVLTGTSLDQVFAPIKYPDRFQNITSPTWQVLGQGGAEALCWELANDTCYETRGLITANVNIPMFYIRPGEWFVFALAERLAYKTARDGLPLPAPPNVISNGQSTISLDYRWLTAGQLPAGVPGVAVAGVMFDFSNVSLPPGSVARGESSIIMRRMAGTGAINNLFVDPILGTGPGFLGQSNYLHEYRVQVGSGHHILAGDSSGTILNGVVTSGTPCFFTT